MWACDHMVRMLALAWKKDVAVVYKAGTSVRLKFYPKEETCAKDIPCIGYPLGRARQPYKVPGAIFEPATIVLRLEGSHFTVTYPCSKQTGLACKLQFNMKNEVDHSWKDR